VSDVFDDRDPLNDPHWRKTTKPKRRAGRYIGCPVAWFVWVFPLLRSKEQLALALYLYRRCCVCRSDTVTVPTDELTELGLGRWGKYRLLLSLERAGILRFEQSGQQTIKVQLCSWPDPPSIDRP
jgi:hypothetical protein